MLRQFQRAASQQQFNIEVIHVNIILLLSGVKAVLGRGRLILAPWLSKHSCSTTNTGSSIGDWRCSVWQPLGTISLVITTEKCYH